MSTGIWSAASGAVGQTAALDVAANNVANATTPGYRADAAVFRQTLANAVGRSVGSTSQRYAITRTTSPDMRMGQLVHTGRSLDVAISDDRGFFAVATPDGERYTRAGSFRMRTDGTLVTAEGFSVLGSNRRPIQLPAAAGAPGVAADGSIHVNGEPTGTKIGLFTFTNLSGLEKSGQVMFRARPEAGAPQPHDAVLEAGTLEQSNANAVSSMTTLVNASRQFEMMARVIEAFSQIDRRAATDIMGRT
ncbi:MAG TPA: flagellar basal-body rod protein FlgF [Polyangiaceae bacterium]|nr:flagellar basal-body rod protein FlgF [Polyangiaceae bacterium]